MVKNLHTKNPFLWLVVIFTCLVTFPGIGSAEIFGEADPEESDSTKIKIASGGLTLLYLPVKAAYAGLGAIIGGIGYVLNGGDEEMGEVVWTPTMKGTYIITPEHLRGEKPVQFFGKAEGDTSEFLLGRGKHFKKSLGPKKDTNR
jgi:hypothetical protein